MAQVPALVQPLPEEGPPSRLAGLHRDSGPLRRVQNNGVTAPYITDPLVAGALPRWLDRLIDAKEAAAFGHQEALRWFVEGMVELEPSGYVQLICQLLDFHRPRAGWKHLDRHVRQRFAWHAAAMDVVGGRLVDGTAGPVSWVLAGMHPDGRVRQRAIDVMCAGCCPALSMRT